MKKIIENLIEVHLKHKARHCGDTTNSPRNFRERLEYLDNIENKFRSFKVNFFGSSSSSNLDYHFEVSRLINCCEFEYITPSLVEIKLQPKGDLSIRHISKTLNSILKKTNYNEHGFFEYNSRLYLQAFNIDGEYSVVDDHKIANSANKHCKIIKFLRNLEYLDNSTICMPYNNELHISFNFKNYSENKEKSFWQIFRSSKKEDNIQENNINLVFSDLYNFLNNTYFEEYDISLNEDFISLKVLEGEELQNKKLHHHSKNKLSNF